MVRSSLGLFLIAAAAQAVPEGFVIREFLGNAQEPEIYPTAVSAAANGDVYVSSDKNGSLGHVPGMGRILIARDTKGAGVADQVIEYAKVESPRGGHFVGGVFYLVHPPFLSKFQDKNGDGKADYDTERTLLVDGLGGGIEHPRGADHTTNGTRMGIDGWLYIAVGDFGAGLLRDQAGAIGLGDKKRVTLYGGGVMRVRPDGTIHGGFSLTAEDWPRWTDVDLALRMEFGIRCAHAHGVAALRTHVDSETLAYSQRHWRALDRRRE